jgi:hypothetical protein
MHPTLLALARRCHRIVPALALLIAGCGHSTPSATGPSLAHTRGPGLEAVKVVTLTGFDAAGEPEIRVMPDGSLYVVFSYMPPPDLAEKEHYFLSFFAKQMSHAIDLPVETEEREFFHIKNPRPDTIERLTHFVEQYRGEHETEIEAYVPPAGAK